MFQLAELYSKDHEFITDVKFIMNENDDQMIIVPKSRRDFIFFHPEEDLLLFSCLKEEIGIYQLSFKEIKFINRKFYYVFTCFIFHSLLD